jgi:hypothetical protein
VKPSLPLAAVSWLSTMRGKLFYFLFFFCNIPRHLAVVNPPYGQLQVQGIYITNSSGIPIQLQGMSLYFSQMAGQFWNQDVIVSTKNQWNSNVVRAAMALDRGGYVEDPESNYAKAKAVIEAAINIGMYVIVDWHDQTNVSYTPQVKQILLENSYQLIGHHILLQHFKDIRLLSSHHLRNLERARCNMGCNREPCQSSHPCYSSQ